MGIQDWQPELGTNLENNGVSMSGPEYTPDKMSNVILNQSSYQSCNESLRITARKLSTESLKVMFSDTIYIVSSNIAEYLLCFCRSNLANKPKHTKSH